MTTRIGSKVGESGDYTITAVVETGEWGWACGYQMFGDKKYWCTWEYRTDRENDYYHGHYMMPDEETAQKDMLHRACLLRETYADAYVEVRRIGTEVAGYTITDIFENKNYGVALGMKTQRDGSPVWATWEYTPGREDDYISGHYDMGIEKAMVDFVDRMPWMIKVV